MQNQSNGMGELLTELADLKASLAVLEALWAEYLKVDSKFVGS